MNIFKSKYSSALSILKKLRSYGGFTAIIIILCTYSFMLYRINVLTEKEPSIDDKTEKILELRPPTIDQKAVDAINQLEERNVEVKALFDNARDNPFNTQ